MDEVPYTAYKSKRHSRTISNSHLIPNMSPPLIRTSSVLETFTPAMITVDTSGYLEKEDALDWSGSTNGNGNGTASASGSGSTSPYSGPSSPLVSSGRTSATAPPLQLNGDDHFEKEKSLENNSLEETPTLTITESNSVEADYSTQRSHPNSTTQESSFTDNPATPPEVARTLSSSPALSSSSSTQPSRPRKSSTFRRVPRPTRTPLPSSPLRPGPPPSSTASPTLSETRSLASNSPSIRAFDLTANQPLDPHQNLSPVQRSKQRETIGTLPVVGSSPKRSSVRAGAVSPPPLDQSHLPPPLMINATSNSSTASRTTSTSSTQASSTPTPTPTPSSTTPAPSRNQTPYRPGFQPRGVYRNRTDELVALRRTKKDEGRVERERLERRWDKLVALHFPIEHPSDNARAPTKPPTVSNGTQPKPNPTLGRRASSLFDFDFQDLKKDPGGLLKGVLARGMSDGMMRGKSEIRVAEQRITPWQEDATVSKCPLCGGSFHPLTNRKHHCRLCGQIVCSQPVKHPQRPAVCSLLFVVDPRTRAVEEVGEGVDYGVRRRRDSVSSPSSSNGDGSTRGKSGVGEEDEEKFLKGVRICRECRPTLRRRQFYQELTRVPPFVQFHEAFVTLEKEIEGALPQFQELILSLSQDAPTTKEASAARKRLLAAFAQYDALSKRIRNMACTEGPGSSQDRVQSAVLMRANIFLQKNMFPLQSLPTPKSKRSSVPGGGGDSSSSTGSSSHQAETILDPDSVTAHALQPLLEQEALLETFVEEAKAHRKFEDVKTLKANLKEIRAEIDRVMANSGGT